MNSHPVVAAAVELQPLIREHLVAGEKRARLTEQVVTAAGQAGLFRLFAPREVGGLDVLPSVGLAAIEAVSAADPALGWYMVNSTPACLTAAYVAESARAEPFAETDQHFGFSAAPSGKAIPSADGYHVSGEWPLVTGCEDAKWCALSGVVMDGDAPRQVNGLPDGRLFLIPTSALTIAQTWNEAAAMRGTDSNAVSAQNVWVPEELAHTPSNPLVIDRPLYRLPLTLFFGIMDPAVAFGILRTAVETAEKELSTKISSFDGQAQRDHATIQELVAESFAALQAIRAGLLQLTDELGEHLTAGTEVPSRLKARIHASAFYGMKVARETISALYAQCSRAASIQGHPLERALRNIHAVEFGLNAARYLYHSAGRVLLGGEPTHPAF